jgi:hypothetical protein
MRHAKRHRRFVVETVLAIITGALTVLTAFWPDWIEGLTRSDPDNHNGSVEVVIVIAFALATAVLTIAALRDRRALHGAPGETPPQSAP